MSFETLTSTETGQQPIEIKLRFTDKEKNKSIIKALTIVPGFMYSNAVYALWGPVRLSDGQYNQVEYKPADLPPGYYRITRDQAKALVGLGYGDMLGCDATKYVRRYVLTGLGYNGTTLHSNADGSAYSQFGERNSVGYKECYIEPQYAFENIAVASGIDYSNAQVVHRSTRISFGYNGAGRNIRIECTSYPTHHYMPDGKTIACTEYKNLSVGFIAGGSFDQISGYSGGHNLGTPNNAAATGHPTFSGIGSWWLWDDLPWEGKEDEYRAMPAYTTVLNCQYTNKAAKGSYCQINTATYPLHPRARYQGSLPTYYLKKIKDLGQ